MNDVFKIGVVSNIFVRPDKVVYELAVCTGRVARFKGQTDSEK